VDLDTELAALEKAYVKAHGGKRDELLFTALLMCWERPLPEWVFTALAKLLVTRLPKPSVDQQRWTVARALLGPENPIFERRWERWKSAGLLTEKEQAWDDAPPQKWDEVWERASAILTAAGRPAKPETIRKSYARVERGLPPAQRRPLTWRRH
jgi:hypothetical protein